MTRSKSKLCLNHKDKKFLGVCAGIADYLGVEPWTVRLVFLVSFFMGAWFLVIVYFGIYFCFDSKSGGIREGLTDNATLKHFKNVDYKKKLYRNKEDAKFLGVCAGIADYLEIDVKVVRVTTFVLFFVAGPIPWLAYFGAYFILDKKPVNQLTYFSGEEKAEDVKPMKEKFQSGRGVFRDCVRKFSTLQDRLIRMEAYVTSSQFKLNREFRNIS